MSYATEEEQIEAIKQWWRENGKSVFIGIVIGLAALLGWQQWQSYHSHRAEAASTDYMEFLSMVQGGKTGQGMVSRGESIVKQYAGTPYAALTSLTLARQSVESGKLDEAVRRLEWVIKNADSAPLVDIARVRLARVRIAQKDYAQALKLTEQSPGSAFASEYAEIRGDAYAGQNKRAEAIKAYQKALAQSDVSGQRRSLIELKLHDLGAKPAEPTS